MNATAKDKARNLRYKKALLSRFNYYAIRERLEEISEDCDCMLQKAVDYLLDNGVIVPPCKVGDKVYQYDNAGRIYESEVVWFYYDKDYKRVVYDCNTELAFSEEAIGKTVFLSREEEENALKECER